jgi:RimJ/RimL family protein N-acetyltransferase
MADVPEQRNFMNVLETERLRLRRVTIADAVFILELLNEPAFLRYIGDKGVRSVDDACTYIREGPIASYERYGFGMYIVSVIATDEPVGICGLVKRDTLDDVDIGFAFLSRFWSLGYAFEAASAVMDHARAVVRLDRVAGVTVPENTSSIRLLEKLGLAFERTVRLSAEGPELHLYAAAFGGANGG